MYANKLHPTIIFSITNTFFPMKTSCEIVEEILTIYIRFSRWDRWYLERDRNIYIQNSRVIIGPILKTVPIYQYIHEM